MNNYLLITVILLSGLMVISCSSNVPIKAPTSTNVPTDTPTDTPTDWVPRNRHDQVVWANDGSDLAMVVISEENLISFAPDQHQFFHQIWVQNLDGSGQRNITDMREHQTGKIFYMKPAGYLVVESLLDNGKRRFDKVALDNGNEILIVETPDNEHQPCFTMPAKPVALQVYQTVIPSPDGMQLAHIYSPECGKVTVEFLDAKELNLLDNQTMTIEEPMRALWHPDGYIILVTNSQAWKFALGGSPMPTSFPNCLEPVTSSSNVSLAGKMVYFEGEKLMTKEVDRQQVFGCQ